MSRINGHNVEHFETPADNVDNLKDFYYSLFGWQFTKGQTQAFCKLDDKKCWQKWPSDAKGKSQTDLNVFMCYIVSGTKITLRKWL